MYAGEGTLRPTFPGDSLIPFHLHVPFKDGGDTRVYVERQSQATPQARLCWEPLLPGPWRPLCPSDPAGARGQGDRRARVPDGFAGSCRLGDGCRVSLERMWVGRRRPFLTFPVPAESQPGSGFLGGLDLRQSPGTEAGATRAEASAPRGRGGLDGEACGRLGAEAGGDRIGVRWGLSAFRGPSPCPCARVCLETSESRFPGLLGYWGWLLSFLQLWDQV